MRQALLPILRQQVGPARDGVDIRGERQRHDIGLEPIDHGTRLGAGAAVRLIHTDRFAPLGMPARRERLVDGCIEAPGRIVRGVQKRGLRRRLQRIEQLPHHQEGERAPNQHRTSKRSQAAK